MGGGRQQFFVCGNWKMNGDKDSIDGIVSFLNSSPLDPDAEVIIAVPAVYLDYVQGRLPKGVSVAAQNCYKEAKGAFTGAISPAMIKDVGAKWVVLGHPEHRHVFGESDELIADKVEFCLRSGLNILLAISPKLPEPHSASDLEEETFRQLAAVAPRVTDWSRVVLAYELGTGATAAPAVAQRTLASIRNWLRQHISEGVSQSVRIVYAGGVTGANCGEYAACDDIDGCLVGAASLRPEFVTIINAKTPGWTLCLECHHKMARFHKVTAM